MDEFNRNENALMHIPPCLRSNFKELYLRGKIGLSSVCINDVTIVSNKGADDCNYGYHFIIKIPYAGRRLSWDVIFNPEDFYFAPDFDFNDEAFLANPDIGLLEEHVPSLGDWDVRNPKSLILVLSEFLSLYRKEQVNKLKKENIYSKILEEYEALTCEKGISSDNVEIVVDTTIVHFLISLQIDFNSLPEYMQPEFDDPINCGEDFVHLRISFTKLDGSRKTPALLISPRMEQIIGNSKTFSIPEFKKEFSLMDYVPLIQKQIDEKIEIKLAEYEIRTKFITYLICSDPDNVVKYDTVYLTFCKILYKANEDDETEYLIEISTDNQFPNKKPNIVLYYNCDKIDCQDVVKGIQWNPNAGIREMVNNVFNSLQEELPRISRNHKH